MQSAPLWETIQNQLPLCEVPGHFHGIRSSRYMTDYLSTALRFCPDGGRSLELGCGSGYGAVWLSLRGIEAHGADELPELVERAKQINDLLGGTARFSTLTPDQATITEILRFSVIHHQ